MPAVSCACPRCRAALQPPDALPATVECRRCGARCTLTAAGTVIPLPSPAQAAPAAQGQPAMGILVNSRPKPVPPPAPPAPEPAAAPEPEGERPPVLLYAGLALLSVVVIGGAVWVVVAHERHRARPAAVAENDPPAAPAPAEEEAPPARPAPAPAPAPTPAPTPPAPQPEQPPAPKNPLAGYVPPSAAGGGKSVAVSPSLQVPGEGEWESSLSREDQERVNQAIDRGVAYLKGRVANGDPLMGRRGGPALVGLTLLACGVPADDPAVRTLVERVRTGGDSEQLTYDLALSILFLDRLGEPADRELIRTFALRLVAGQNGSGGWSYQCPLLRDTDRDELLDLLETLSPPPGTGAAFSDPDGRTGTSSGAEPGRAPSPGATSSAGRVMPSSPPRKAHGDARRRPSRETASVPLKSLAVVRLQPGDKPNFQEISDNSNTQFAILALWVARKYGVPVERTLALVDARFRTSQNPDGSWGYNPRLQNWPDSMTCSGLLGLAVGRGIVRGDDARKDSASDPAIARGLRFLGNRIGRPVGGAGGRPRRGTGRIVGANAHGDLYFLWSVERVAVVYDLRTIADKDWYAWGAQLLVDHQNPDGSWRDNFDEPVDTCFALLFLKRVNVAQDLTATLRSIDNLVDQADGRKVGRVPPK